MKINSKFIALGSLLLAIIGFISANANKNFASTRTAFFRTSCGFGLGDIRTLFKAASGILYLTTVKQASGKTAFFCTSSCSHTLFAIKTAGGTLQKTLFFKN
jgi:hypothetical protein